jgi:hypothetical protein
MSIRSIYADAYAHRHAQSHTDTDLDTRMKSMRCSPAASYM